MDSLPSTAVYYFLGPRETDYLLLWYPCILLLLWRSVFLVSLRLSSAASNYHVWA